MKNSILFTGALGALLCFPPDAYAAPTPAAQSAAHRRALPVEGVITNPDWIQKPSGEEVARLFPKLAEMLRISGRVEIMCAVTALGSLEHCKSDNERPEGLGFGKAALLMAALFHMRPTTVDGVAVAGGEVRIPIRFTMAAREETSPVIASADSVKPPPKAMILAVRLVSMIGSSKWIADGLRKGFEVRVGGDEQTEADPAARQTALDAFDQAASGTTRRYADALASTYARLFTELELTELIAFFESPVGRKWHASGKGIEDAMKDSSRALWIETEQDAKRRFCLKVACLPEPGSGPTKSP